MMNRLCSSILLSVVFVGGQLAAASTTIDFQDHPLPTGGYWNGSDMSGGFTSRGAYFNNSFTDWGGDAYSWSNWAYSNVSDTSTPDYGNQYAAYTGAGFGGSGNYGVAYFDAYSGTVPYIDLPSGQTPVSVRVTNTTYAALSMLNGDSFAAKFGWRDTNKDGIYEYAGNYPDYFSLTLTGYNGFGATGAATGSTTFYLADYHFANDAQDYIVNTWQSVDLTPLGNAKSIKITFDSSDKGSFGINTPTYAAFDNFVATPEPSSFILLVAGSLAALAWRWRRRK